MHRTPADLGRALGQVPAVRATWQALTPLARNEWVCWVTSAKQATTRARRIERALEDLGNGKRRPCCWPGCPHRRPSAQKWFDRSARRTRQH